MDSDDQQLPRERREDDFDVRTYEDELDNDDDDTDPIMAEETDDPTRELGVPSEELKRELDKLDPEGEDDSYDDEDMREYIEDQDKNLGDKTAY